MHQSQDEGRPSSPSQHELQIKQQVKTANALRLSGSFCMSPKALTLLSASLACWLVEPSLHVKLPLLLEVLVGNHIVM